MPSRSTSGASSSVPVSMAGEAVLRWKSPLASSTNRGGVGEIALARVPVLHQGVRHRAYAVAGQVDLVGRVAPEDAIAHVIFHLIQPQCPARTRRRVAVERAVRQVHGRRPRWPFAEVLARCVKWHPRCWLRWCRKDTVLKRQVAPNTRMLRRPGPMRSSALLQPRLFRKMHA